MTCGCNETTKSSNPSETVQDKHLKVDFLFLDETTCAPCGGTADALSNAIDLILPALDAMGISLSVEKIHVADKGIAVTEGFLASPTIRVDGTDIDPARTEDDCPSCGTLTGDLVSVSCRTWHWQDKVYQAAPVGKIIEEIMSAALLKSIVVENCCNLGEPEAEYTLPDNLDRFFKARASNEQLGC